jgi:ribosomal protein S8
MSNPLSNLLSHIKNAQINRILVISHPRTKLIVGFLKVLREHGYIRGYRFHSHWNKPNGKIEILFKYRNQTPAINKIMRISKPSKKLYITVKALAGPLGPLPQSPCHRSPSPSPSPSRRRHFAPFMKGIYILSTPLGGILSSTKAHKLNTGGEILGHV